MTTLPGFHAPAVGIVDGNPSILVGDRPDDKLWRTLDTCFPTVREDALHVRLMHQGLRGCTLPKTESASLQDWRAFESNQAHQ